ncbi:MAG: hypothetical protein JXA96_05065 [Sedimentisphaerales bacterium]|nr:hypothetical protein [Sedimentisphaerales bacterium]
MKRQSILVLFATLILCFWSSSVFAEMYEYFGEGDIVIGLATVYDKSIPGFNETNGGWIEYHFLSIPDSDYDYKDLSYDDSIVSGYSSAYWDFILENYEFTISMGVSGWIQNPQGVEPIQFQYDGFSYLSMNIYFNPDEIGKLKLKITGATFDSENDPDLDLYIAYNGSKLELNGTESIIQVSDGFLPVVSIHPVLHFSGTENESIKRDIVIHGVFEPVPVPGAALLGLIGLSYSGLRLRRKTI